MRLKLSAILFFCLFVKISAQGEISEPYIAVVNDDTLTVRKFIELYEMTPHINNTSTYASSVDFLHTLVAYKLWSGEKEKLGIETSEAFLTARRELEKVFTLDAFYRKKIVESFKVKPGEYAAAKGRMGKELIVEGLRAEDSAEAFGIFSLLEEGFPLDTLAAGHTTETRPVNFGDYKKYVEDILYSLEPGDYSCPVLMDEGYYIFRLANIKTKLWRDPATAQEDSLKIIEVLKEREETVNYDNYITSVLGDLKGDTDKKLFDKLLGILKTSALRNAEEGKDEVYIDFDLYAKILGSFDNRELSSGFIKSGVVNVELNTFLGSIFFNGLSIPADTSETAVYLTRLCRDYLLKETVYRDAISYGFDRLPEVKEDLDTWLEFYSFETFRAAIYDTVTITDEEVKKGIADHGTDPGKIKRTIAARKTFEEITERTALLAAKAEMNINYKFLEGLELTNINSMVIRKLGFGNSIKAAPLYYPNYKWVELINSYKEIL